MNRAAASGAAPTALVVDDDYATRLLARSALEAAGFRVEEACDGREALAALTARAPELVILDVLMPDLDGFETCAQIRARGSDVPVMLMTASDDARDIERAFEVGATDFVSKPVSWTLLQHRARFLVRAGDAFRSLRCALDDLSASRERLAAAQAQAGVGDWECEIDSQTFAWSEQALRILGVDSPGPSTWEGFLALVPADERPELEKALQNALAEGAPFRVEHHVATPSGARVVDHQGRHSLALDGRSRLLGTLLDITDRRASEEQVRRLAYFDSLTGLPNRRLFVDRLTRTLQFARGADRKVALFFVDIDRFKRVNDTLGHAMGDQLLEQIAGRIVESVRWDDTVARGAGTIGSVSRLGGDEFTVMAVLERGAEGASLIARRILSALNEPFVLGDARVTVGASVGIALFPDDGDTADQLLRQADLAMYQVKSAGRDGFQFFTPALNFAATQALQVETDLRRAIAERELFLVYQPQVSAVDGRVEGVEALIRWRTPEGVVRGPADFLATAHDSGLIVPIGDWVLQEACRQAREWSGRGLGARVAVNVAAQQFRDGKLVPSVRQALAESGLQPTQLELEITESVVMDDQDLVLASLRELARMGVRLALDDFGTGYSCLSSLKRMPLDVVKIDRSFVQDIADDEDDDAIVCAIIALARQLRLRVVAEGVETAVQAERVRERGCDVLQGYLLGRPMPREELEAWLRGRVEGGLR